MLYRGNFDYFLDSVYSKEKKQSNKIQFFIWMEEQAKSGCCNYMPIKSKLIKVKMLHKRESLCIPGEGFRGGFMCGLVYWFSLTMVLVGRGILQHHFQVFQEEPNHRRRINTEEKAKVVAAV